MILSLNPTQTGGGGGQRARGCILCCIFRKPLARLAWNFLIFRKYYIGSILRNFFFFILPPVKTSQHHSVMTSLKKFRHFDFVFKILIKDISKKYCGKFKVKCLKIKEFTRLNYKSLLRGGSNAQKSNKKMRTELFKRQKKIQWLVVKNLNLNLVQYCFL